MLNELHSAEIARLLESLPHTKRNLIWDLVDSGREGEVLLHLGEEVRTKTGVRTQFSLILEKG